MVDTALIAQWNETFGDGQVAKVSLKNPVTGKSVVCEFKPFKESKFEGKGIVQLSDKTQAALDAKKGSQILLKPVTEDTKIEPSFSKKSDSINLRNQNQGTCSRVDKKLPWILPDGGFSRKPVYRRGRRRNG